MADKRYRAFISYSQKNGDGHGLSAMATRARAVGGELTVRSQPGQGTTVTLRAPLGRRRRALWPRYAKRW
jgi:nitrate/nitrite-specific signal transduction histidine kinase